MNCLVVDDDEVTRLLLEKFIKKTRFIKLIKILSNPIDVVNYFNDKYKIDLLFVDIEMPDMTGLDLIGHLPYHPQIIVISAKDKYAVNAFEFNVVDYIVKPITYTRFLKSVNKAQKQHESLLKPINKNDGLFIKLDSSEMIKFKFIDILWIVAEENYSILYTAEKKQLLNYMLKVVFEKLPSAMFMRVHRSYIVNIQEIDSIKDRFAIINRKDRNYQIPIARTYRNELINRLNIL